MVWKNHESTTVVGCILLVITLSQIPSNGFVEGRTGSIIKHKGNKTIVSEDGDIFDCIDIYKQPAFNHPLLKNHTIQMKPSSSADKFETRSSDVGLFQNWLMNGQCPKGTIPIIRTKFPPKRYVNYKFLTNETNHDQTLADIYAGHEYAVVNSLGDYNGAKARLNVWKPRVAASEGEFSLSQIWVVAGENNNLNTVEAGWMVRTGDENARFFIYWTRDDYQTTGCYNLDCPGFVQTSKNVAIGAIIKPLSVYNGQQKSINITIHKEPSGNWWLNVQNVAVGYWPASILTTLTGGATRLSWGGEIINSKPNGQHTSTEMGSGHFPNEGFGKASHFRNLGYYDNTGAIRDAEDLIPYASNPTCYDVQVA